jgi:DNA adenine methylase
MSEKQKRVKPILRWPGGKSRHLPVILPLITPHLCYVEPFAGGLAVLLAKERSRTEVVNDTNGTLVALYRNAQWHCEALLKELEFVLNSRQTLHEFLKQPGLTEIQRVARYLVCNKISFGGNGHSFSVSKGQGGGAGISRENIQTAIRELNQRLDKVVVENLPYDHCVRLYDSKDAFFFFDPPYLHAKVGPYKGWDEKQMTEFAELLPAIQGNWVVTVDGSDFNRRLFKRWNLQKMTLPNQCLNSRKHVGRTFDEFVITKK